MTVIKRVIRRHTVVIVAALLGISGSAAAEQFDRGQALYENHCQACHEDWAHKREQARAVGSLDALRARVSGWSVHSGLDWSAEEIDDVTSYLNRRFYKLTK
ncbi:MAG: cytochrome c [Thiogranum sp.]|nr:cytochrome c [Thiogranum sp.]